MGCCHVPLDPGHWESTAHSITAEYPWSSCLERVAWVWNWGHIKWTWVEGHRREYKAHTFRTVEDSKTGTMEELFQIGRNGRRSRIECNTQAWRRFWTGRGKARRWDSLSAWGLCLGWGLVPELDSRRVARRRCSRTNMVWEAHTVVFRDDGIFCLQLALQRFRQRIMERVCTYTNRDKTLTVWDSGWGVYESSLYCSSNFFISLKLESIFFFKIFFKC